MFLFQFFKLLFLIFLIFLIGLGNKENILDNFFSFDSDTFLSVIPVVYGVVAGY